MAESRTNKQVLVDVESKLLEHDLILKDLKLHFNNHLTHHEEREKAVSYTHLTLPTKA